MAELHTDPQYARVVVSDTNDANPEATGPSEGTVVRRCTVAAGCSLLTLIVAVFVASSTLNTGSGAMVRHGTADKVIVDSSLSQRREDVKQELAELEAKLKRIESKATAPQTTTKAPAALVEDFASTSGGITTTAGHPPGTQPTTPGPRYTTAPHGLCTNKFVPPEKPQTVDEHNGIALQDVCLEGDGPFHAFIIGDWGAIVNKNGAIEAASHLSHRWGQAYKFVWPVDQKAQSMIAGQMAKRATFSKPDYVLNVGDNFYWAGVEDHCGAPDITETYSGGGTALHKQNPVDQFQVLFEDMYKGPEIDGKPWLGVLGNHDYGGWRMDHAWDQAIGYTWSQKGTGRWITPALYWQVKVNYPDFSVDYYFLDTNIWDALDPKENNPHNICSEAHNPKDAKCPGGPMSIWQCESWFDKLWNEQKNWLEDVVPKSTADWRIVVTHFPPYWGKHEWKKLGEKHEIDLVVTGHRHSQFTRQVGDKAILIWPEWGKEAALKEGYTDFMDPTAWVVSGGGGGVTSEHVPQSDGTDDQYGFMDLTLEKDKLTIEAISHGGILRRTMVVEPHYPHNQYWRKWAPRPTNSTSHAGGEEDWEPVGNRGDVACRAEDDGAGTEGVDFKVHVGISSLQQCKQLCKETAGCKGVEHTTSLSDGRCEVWTAPISGSADHDSYTCLRYHTGKPS
jgi:hypothetical protein